MDLEDGETGLHPNFQAGKLEMDPIPPINSRGQVDGEESLFHVENLKTTHKDMGARGLGISAGINSNEKINSVCESLGGPTIIVPGSNNTHDACIRNDGSSNVGHGIAEHISSPISNLNASSLEFEPGDSAIKRHRTKQARRGEINLAVNLAIHLL